MERRHERLTPAIHKQYAISAGIYLIKCLENSENTSEAYRRQVSYINVPYIQQEEQGSKEPAQ